MSKTKLSATGLTALQNKDIDKYVRLELNDVENSNLVSYSFTNNKDFASGSLEVELENGDGRYSIGGANEIQLNTKVEFIEGLTTTSSTETFPKFTGLVRQRNIGKKAGRNTIRLTCFDYLIRMQDLDYNATLDSTKTTATRELMQANAIEGNSSFAQIFDFQVSGSDVTNIAPYPEPIIRIEPLSADSTYEPLWEGYKIYYQEGQLRLNTPLDITSWRLRATFSYYAIADAYYAEDLIEDIIETNDESGNLIFPGFAASTHLRSTYTDEGESLPDVMTLNTTAVTIDGTEYAAGRVAYTLFDNITTSLADGDFTYVGGGGTPTINLRYGALIFPSTVTSCQCDVNYTFKTVQASGIQIPYIDLTTRSIRNRFEAIKRIKDCLAPNYCIYCDGEGKFWGKYLNQKTTADYTLYLETALDYAESDEVYSRVKIYGQSTNPINLMDSFAVFSSGFDYVADTGGWTALVHNPTWDLNYDIDRDELGSGDMNVQHQWRAFDTTVDGVIDILEQGEFGEPVPTPKPRLQIDGVEIRGSEHHYTFQDVSVDMDGHKRLRDIYDGDTAKHVFSMYRVLLPHHDIFVDDAHPIEFYDHNYRKLYTLTDTHYTLTTANASTRYRQLDTKIGEWFIPQTLITSQGKDILYIGASVPWRSSE